MKEWRIYFLRPVGHEGPIKVGFTGSTDKRLRAYQSWSPWKLEIVATLPVSPNPTRCQQRQALQAIERRFHERYMQWFLHHEWFEPNPLMEADIAAIQAGTFDINDLPPATRASWRLQSRFSARQAA